MNAKKKNGEFAGVRRKLTAAVAMLLVATIMMASSTYAWFTLSTAPEITGITTSVGANGNLEMALSGGAGTAPSASAVGDQGNNLTWGNLVNLSDNQYGLNNITLKPSRLNVSSTGTVSTNPLLVAQYGADGRVSSLSDATMSGVFSTEQNGFVTGDTSNAYGVRGLGQSTNMTEMELARYTALIAVENNISAAKQAANESITLYGNTLAQMAVRHAMTNDSSDVYTEAEVQALNNLLAKLRTSKANIEKALINSLVVLSASKDVGSKELYAAVSAAAKAEGATLTTVETAATTALTENTEYAAAKAIYASITIPEDVTATADNDGVGTNTWTKIGSTVDAIVKADGIKLNGKSVEEIKALTDLNELIALANNATLEMGEGSGVYYNIASLVGNIGGTIGDLPVKYNDTPITMHNVYMKTTFDGTAKMKALGVKLAELQVLAEATTTDTVKVVNDLYGFAIDLWFRTNASGSNLLLQTTATNRIYSTGGSSEAMGGGSTYTFTLPGDSVGLEAARNLAACIHVVFTDSEGNIKGVAGLDTANVTESAADGGVTQYTCNLVMMNFTIDNVAAEGADAQYKLTVGEKKTGDNAAVITSLNQNQATRISAYVYLDGDVVDNSMVAATTTQSMTGTLNLQFASDATLKPMDYSPLKDQTVTPETSSATTPSSSVEPTGE